METGIIPASAAPAQKIISAAHGDSGNPSLHLIRDIVSAGNTKKWGRVMQCTVFILRNPSGSGSRSAAAYRLSDCAPNIDICLCATIFPLLPTGIRRSRTAPLPALPDRNGLEMIQTHCSLPSSHRFPPFLKGSNRQDWRGQDGGFDLSGNVISCCLLRQRALTWRE